MAAVKSESRKLTAATGMVSIDSVIPYPLKNLRIRYDFWTGGNLRNLDARRNCKLPQSLQRLNGKLRLGSRSEAVGVDDRRISGVGAGDVDVTSRKGRKDRGREEHVVVF